MDAWEVSRLAGRARMLARARINVREIVSAARRDLGRPAKRTGRVVDWDAVRAVQSALSVAGHADAVARLARWVPPRPVSLTRLVQAWTFRAARAGLI